MVIRECVWDVCVYISCTGDEGQLGSSFVSNGRDNTRTPNAGLLETQQENQNTNILNAGVRGTHHEKYDTADP